MSKPIGGTVTITAGNRETDALAFNASPDAIDHALNVATVPIQPCPFCGSVRVKVGSSLHRPRYRARVRCLKCDIYGPSTGSESQKRAETLAVLAWNNRAPENKLREAAHVFLEARKHGGYGMDEAERAIRTALDES